MEHRYNDNRKKNRQNLYSSQRNKLNILQIEENNYEFYTFKQFIEKNGIKLDFNLQQYSLILDWWNYIGHEQRRTIIREKFLDVLDLFPDSDSNDGNPNTFHFIIFNFFIYYSEIAPYHLKLDLIQMEKKMKRIDD